MESPSVETLSPFPSISPRTEVAQPGPERWVHSPKIEGSNPSLCTNHKQCVRRFLDLIILRFLNGQSMYGYQILVKIRKTFGVYFSTSTIYVLLRRLEKKGFIRSNWGISACTGKSRRDYTLTTEGSDLLNCTETFVILYCGRSEGTKDGGRRSPLAALRRAPA